MKRAIIFLLSFGVLFSTQAQNNVDSTGMTLNTADVLMSGGNKLRIGGYAELDYNQPIGSAGKLDVHRLVMLFNYKFSNKTQFLTEIEYEHVKEVYIEQAFLSHRFNKYFNFRGGLMLVPMGIVNEYHEPTTFNGVERPNVDKYIIPSTWRELGAGFTGRLDDLQLKYQVYVMNGFKSWSFDTDETLGGISYLNGKNGLRSGRQKGAESFMSSPNLSMKFDFYGIRGLKLGASGYFGKTQSNDIQNDEVADSTTVGVNMIGLDARYDYKGWHLRGQYIHNFLTDVAAYNAKTNQNLGEQMMGYYVEASYNVFQTLRSEKTQLIPFVRYERYNTHYSVSDDLAQAAAYDRTEITAGLGWKLTAGSILKLDYQWRKTEAGDVANQFNAGIGVWFN